MALEVSTTTDLSRDGKTITFTETTGAYNAITNPTGYSAPNPPISDMIAATLVVTAPDGIEYEFDLFTEGFPNSTNPTFEITADMIGGVEDNTIIDGLYTFVYTVTESGPVFYSFIDKVAFYHNIKCCVFKAITNVEAIDCNCSDSSMKYTVEMWALYQSLVANAEHGFEERINILIEGLTKLCNNQPCNC